MKVLYFSKLLRCTVILFFLAATIGCYRKNVNDEYEVNDPTNYILDDPNGCSDIERPIYIDGGYLGLLASIYNNLEYPSQARANGTEGKVALKFRINKEGKVDSITTLEDLGDGCGEAAVEALRKATSGKSYEPGNCGNQDKAVSMFGFVNIIFELH